MNGVKRLTPPQSRKVNALVRRTCCNYDNGNCILLDDGDECVCPQLISYSLLCKWFRVAVLPADRLLYAELYQTGDKKKCTECGAFFASTSNSVKYCPVCRKRITRRQAAERMDYHHLSAIPIIDDLGVYIGTLTEGDLLRKLKDTPDLNFENTSKISIADIPRKVVHKTAPVGTDIENIVELARTQNFVPVTDDEGIFIGIIKRSDIIDFIKRSALKIA